MDILSDSFPHRVDRVGWHAGHIHAADEGLARAVLDDEGLRSRIGRLEGQYLRMDADAVTLYWAGNEKDYCSLINRHGNYYRMINELTELLADLADRIGQAG